MVSVGVSQLRLVSRWAELWWLPLHSGLKQRLLPLLLLLLFDVFHGLFIRPLCASQPQERKKKQKKNNKIHCNF